jgi:protein SCO1
LSPIFRQGKCAPLCAVALLVALALAVAGCGGASSGSSTQVLRTSAPDYGTLIEQPVPSSIQRMPLLNQHGEKLDLASLKGKTVVLVPFLTLCADICPFTTGILLQTEKALEAAHATSKVEIVELTVDPHRDTTSRLEAYAKLTHAGWQLVRATPVDLSKMGKFFGFSFGKIPEDNPPSIDWLTGKPLTYDVEHSDNYFVIDGAGNERVVEDAAPDYTGKLNPKLQKFLSAEGRQHQKHPPQPDWTQADLLQAIEHVTGEKLMA